MVVTVDRSDLQRVVAVLNNKGGVGKTTVVANVGGLMAASGWRVLLVDLDHQGNLGLDLGYEGTDRDDDGRALSKAMLYADETPQPIVAVRANLDVLVGGRYLESAAATLASYAAQGRASEAQLSVATLLAKIAGDYDIILIDCPPGNDVIQAAAVAAARYILIPSKTDEGSVKGLVLTAERLDKVIELNPDVDLLGVILFGTGQQAKQVREGFIGQVARSLGGDDARSLIFESYITHAEATARGAREKGLLVHELDQKVRSGPNWLEARIKGTPYESAGPRSARAVADSLQAVTTELIDRLSKKESEVTASV